MATSNLHSTAQAGSGLKRSIRSIRPVNLVIGLIVCAIIISLILWFFRNFEQVITTDYALNTEAQYNPYYAAELLINDQHGGLDAEDAVAISLLDSDLKTLLDELPLMEIDDEVLAEGYRPTIIINSIGTKLTDERFEALQLWIEQGGHLITFATQGSDNDAMQAALERLNALQDEQADPQAIGRDKILNELLKELDSGNQFLNKLGIFRVYTEYNPEDIEAADEDIDAQIETILEEAQKQIDADIPSSEEEIDNLAEYRPLALIDLSAYNTNQSTATLREQKLLLVKIYHSDAKAKLNAQLFQALHPDGAQVIPEQAAADQQSIKQQAKLIRHYIQTSKAGNSSDLEQRLSKLLVAMQALSDEQLVALFYPADSVYLEVNLGKGRLSVINDSDMMRNPNPNTDLADNTSDTQNTISNDETSLAASSALYDLLDADEFLPSSLLSADNAAWLIALTQDSSEVWILPNTDVDSLPLMLWKQAKPALFGLGLLAFLWLWSLYNRFGKMARLSDHQSRDIMRYFRQVGRFGWHHDRAKPLLQATKDQARLVIDEQLKGAQATSSLGYANTGTTSTDDESLSISKLQELLNTRLEDKKTLLQRSISVNEPSSSKANDSLLLNNEAFIRTTISSDRLQNAFDSHLQEDIQAFEFTQITQTLWMIQWLLK